MTLQSHPWDFLEKNMVQKDTGTHPSVHCSTVNSSQDMEATWMSIDRGMNKEGVVDIYNGILLSH